MILVAIAIGAMAIAVSLYMRSFDNANLNLNDGGVPKTVIQTVRSVHDMSNEAKRTTAAARTWADEDGYVYLLFGNDDCERFLRSNASRLPTGTVEAWNTIKPGAFKADLFRYAYLFLKGGIYLDVGHVPLIPINELLLPNLPCRLAMASERSVGGVGAHQAILMAAPKCRVMLAALELCVERILSREKGHNPLWITGPICLHDAMRYKLGFFLPRTVPRGLVWTPWGEAIRVLHEHLGLWTTPSMRQLTFKKKSRDYRTEQKKAKTHYDAMWHANDLFN